VVERQNPLPLVGGDEPARQAVDDVLVQRLEIGDLGRGLLEPCAGAPHRFRQRTAQQGDPEESEYVQRHRVSGYGTGRQQHLPADGPGIVDQPLRRHVLRQHQPAVDHRAQRRHRQPAAAKLHRAGSNDRQHIQRRKEARHPAGEIDEGGDDHRIAAELQIDQPPMPLDEAEGGGEGSRQPVGHRDQQEQRIDRVTAG
jgi:hypothetical protein